MASNRQIYFITFSDGIKYKYDRIKKEAENFERFDNIICYSPENFDNEFKSKHHDFIEKNHRGYGYWLWKPYFVQRTLLEMKENDILVYLDSGCQLNKDATKKFDEYIEIVEKSDHGNIAFEMPYIEQDWTKGDIFEELKMNITQYGNTKQFAAGMIVMRKCTNTIKIVKDWYKYSQDYHLIDDSSSVSLNAPSFIENRHDQSIISLIRKKFVTVIISDGYFEGHEEKKPCPFWPLRLRN
jgi:hypothetical protein